MEHRCTERYPSELKILIYKHNLPVAIGRIKNGNRWGVFIETDFSDIECEQQIGLEVSPNRNSGPRIHQLEMKAMVIHKTQKGFGVELDIQTEEQAELFMDMLLGVKIEPQNFQQVSSVSISMVANG